MLKQILLWSITLLATYHLHAQTEQTTHTVYFDFADSQLTETSQAELEKMLKTLPNNIEDYSIQILGHTDSKGKTGKNQQLSLDRGSSVKTYLIEQGAADHQINLEAMGSESPVAPNSTVQGQAKNRRVELVFTFAPKSKEGIIPLEIPTETVVFDAANGLDFEFERSGSKVKIQPYALMHKDGSLVEGSVKLEYKEFRDIADFIVAGIPMVHQGKAFNSAGMFEMRAFQNGEELLLNPYKPAEVDLALVDELPNAGFFQYSNEKNEWTTLSYWINYDQVMDFSVDKPEIEVKKTSFRPFVAREDILIRNPEKDYVNAMKLGQELIKNKGGFEDTNPLIADFETRQASKDYAGTTCLTHPTKTREQVYNDPQVSGIRVKFLNKNPKYINQLELVDITGNHPELKVLEGRIFEYESKPGELYSAYNTLAEGKWCAITLNEYRSNRNSTHMNLTLKGLNQNYNLKLRPLFFEEEIRELTTQDIVKQLVGEFHKAQNTRARQFDENLLENFDSPMIALANLKMFTQAILVKENHEVAYNKYKWEESLVANPTYWADFFARHQTLNNKAALELAEFWIAEHTKYERSTYYRGIQPFTQFEGVPATIEDTLATFLKVMEIGYQLTFLDKKDFTNRYYLAHTPSFMSFWERRNASIDQNRYTPKYAGMNYIGKALSVKDLKKNPQIYSLRLNTEAEEIGHGQRFSIEDLSGQFTELGVLEGCILEYDHITQPFQGHTQSYIPSKGSVWTDFDLRLTGKNTFEIGLLNENGWIRFQVNVYNSRTGKPEQSDVCSLIAKNYRKKLDERAEKFNTRYGFDENMSRENLLSCFYYFTKAIMTPTEQGMDEDTWHTHFSNYFLHYRERYDQLRKMQNNKATASFIRNLCNRMPRNPIRTNLNTIEENTPKMVQRLSVDGFGIFNVDVLENQEEEPQLMLASYVDEQGNKIHAKSLSVVNYNMNGILSFSPDKFPILQDARMALVVFSVEGDEYIFSAADFDKLDLRDKQKHTFQMRNISTEIDKRGIHALREALKV
ncbi:MAG: OmpA family protein [Saprospiraceae bacterium]|nr:OmpA family protein [Saprospiraceae bacterium]